MGCNMERKLLQNALQEIGFFYLGDFESVLSAKKIESIRTLSTNLFNLGVEEKQSIHLSKSSHFRGWSSVNEEVTLGVPDYKETFDFGLEERVDTFRSIQPWRTMRGPNQWPLLSNDIMNISMRSEILSYMNILQQIGFVITRNAVEALETSQIDLQKYFIHPFCQLRIIKYPPSNGKLIGVGEHSDYGFLTLILQDPNVNGLQAYSRNQEWIHVDTIPNTLAVNIGDVFHVLSGGKYCSTRHRVINHEGDKARISIPFFFDPDLEACMPNNVLVRDGVGVNIYGEHVHRAYLRSYPHIQ